MRLKSLNPALYDSYCFKINAWNNQETTTMRSKSEIFCFLHLFCTLIWVYNLQHNCLCHFWIWPEFSDPIGSNIKGLNYRKYTLSQLPYVVYQRQSKAIRGTLWVCLNVRVRFIVLQCTYLLKVSVIHYIFSQIMINFSVWLLDWQICYMIHPFIWLMLRAWCWVLK